MNLLCNSHFPQILSLHPSSFLGLGLQGTKGDLNYGGLDQEVSKEKNFSVLSKDHSCDSSVKTVAVFCPCPKIMPEQGAGLGSFDHMVLDLVSRIQGKPRCDLPPWLRKATAVRHVSEVSLYGGLKAIVQSCEGESWIPLETPRYWRCQSGRIPAEEN